MSAISDLTEIPKKLEELRETQNLRPTTHEKPATFPRKIRDPHPQDS
jgi:hypothetical protein